MSKCSQKLWSTPENEGEFLGDNSIVTDTAYPPPEKEWLNETQEKQ
jgi:hypothetical protein